MHPIITNIINLFETTTYDLDELTARKQEKKKMKKKDKRLENSTWLIITAQITGCCNSRVVSW